MLHITDEDLNTDEWYEAHLQEVWAETPSATRFWGTSPGWVISGAPGPTQ